MDTSTIVRDAVALGSLSGPALLAVMAIVFGSFAWHLYKTLNKEAQEKTKELISEVKNTNSLIKEQIAVSKASNDSLIKFIETHCSKTNSKLDAIESDLMRMDERLIKISEVKNQSLREIYKRKESND